MLNDYVHGPTHTHLSSTNYGGIGIYKDKALGGVAMIGMMYHGKAGASHYEANGADPFAANMIWTYCASRFRRRPGRCRLRQWLLRWDRFMKAYSIHRPDFRFGRPYARPTAPVTEEILYKLLDQAVEKARSADSDLMRWIWTSATTTSSMRSWRPASTYAPVAQ